MCEFCPAHRIPPFEELIDDPPSEKIDLGVARRDYEMLAKSLKALSPALADGTLIRFASLDGLEARPRGSGLDLSRFES